VLHGQARCMRLEKIVQGWAGMRARAIVPHHAVPSRVGQHVAPKGPRALGVQPPRRPLVANPSRERGAEAQHRVALALAAGGHCGVLAWGGPGGAERAPWGTAGCIATEQQGLALARVRDKLRPRGPTPCQALGFMEVLGDHTRLLGGKPQRVEQGGPRMRRRRAAAAALAAVLPHRRVPAACGLTRRLGARWEPGGQLAALRGGAGARSPWWACVPQTRDALAAQSLARVAQGWLAQVEPLGDLRRVEMRRV
jgi:hypothetical protein